MAGTDQQSVNESSLALCGLVTLLMLGWSHSVCSKSVDESLALNETVDITFHVY